MRAQILAGFTLTIFLGGQAAQAQAAAESVLVNSNSAAATAKAGTSMGNALNAASGRLGNQVQQTIPHRHPVQSGVRVKIERTPRTVAQASSAAAKPATTGGGLITSIQGGHLSSAMPPPAAPAPK